MSIIIIIIIIIIVIIITVMIIMFIIMIIMIIMTIIIFTLLVHDQYLNWSPVKLIDINKMKFINFSGLSKI